MNYSSPTKLLPEYFRLSGFVIAITALLLGACTKIFIAYSPLSFHVQIIQIVFLSGLLSIVFSKDDIEDERIVLIRQQVWNQGYWLMTGFIIIYTVIVKAIGGIGTVDMILSMLTGIIILQTIVFEASKNGTLMDWIEHNKLKYYFLSAVLLLSFVLFSQWFWYA